MSVASEITRLQDAKSALKTSIEAKGVTVSDSTLISGYAALVDEIQTGGGGGDDVLRDLIERDITTLNIPSGTTKIGDYAFQNCTGLTSVTIPNSVTSIGDRAFFNCNSLTSVTIPNSVTSIGGSAFYTCSNLNNIEIPNSVIYIGTRVFGFCEKLTNVIVPNYIPYVDSESFYNCKSLPVENYVQYAGTWALQNKNKTQTSYTLREDTTYLVGTFNNCTGITSVGEIGSGASVEIPNSVVAIGNETFVKCSNLTSVNLPNSVIRINDVSFKSCTNLTSITIPSTINYIGTYAFYWCTGLTSVTIQATTPPTLANTNAFNNTNNCPIYVPAESVDAYKTATNWSSLADRITAIVA